MDICAIVTFAGAGNEDHKGSHWRVEKTWQIWIVHADLGRIKKAEKIKRSRRRDQEEEIKVDKTYVGWFALGGEGEEDRSDVG